MNRFKIYKVLENSISRTKDENGKDINTINYNNSILSSLPFSKGNFYLCIDTLNLYTDSGIGRINVNYTFINTESDRLCLRAPETGYYYVEETNTLWMYNQSWIEYISNKDPNYPGQTIQKDSYNIFADSFKILVNKNNKSKGNLIINPDISTLVTHTETVIDSEGNEKEIRDYNLDRIINSHEYGKMLFFGDYYTSKQGVIKLVTDDGYVTDLVLDEEGRIVR